MARPDPIEYPLGARQESKGNCAMTELHDLSLSVLAARWAAKALDLDLFG